MIPRLPRVRGGSSVANLHAALKQKRFSGDVSTHEATRVLASNDNSIWQQTPEGVIAPKSTGDVELLLGLLATDQFQSISITPRGAGTSTAGQSITDGVSLDCKKHLNRILNVDVQKKLVTVECGAVLATVNSELETHNLKIGPTVATADRATIGGMIGNDSAGKGSLLYGKMSDCVVSLKTVLRGGRVWDSEEIDEDRLRSIEESSGIVGEIHGAVRRACDVARPLLASHWPDLPRFVSGYNLPMGWDGEVFNLNRILCGSEGTLGVITQATLQCVEIPAHQHLIIACFNSFDAALRCGAAIGKYKPSAVEIVDEVVLRSARQDANWPHVSSMLGDQAEVVAAVLFIECSGNDHKTVSNRIIAQVSAKHDPLSTLTLQEPDEIKTAWEFRNRSVGLLSAVGTTKRPVPFVEDCAVPPASLADFIADFRKLLDSHGLLAGMFGHVDAGVIHVRPALDLCLETDRSLVRDVMGEVASLVQTYGGVLWGEHGKGFRSEFGPQVFGEALWKQICRIKAAFDPTDQFNPGKVATPAPNRPLISIDSQTRGEVDSNATRIPILDNTLRCDGNSQCQSVHANSAMCPTFRSTGDPMHSPRGRAELLRHWLARIGGRESGKGTSIVGRLLNYFKKDDFSHDVHDALQGCIGCKACSSGCPMEIDIPNMRSVFLAYYHGRYPRPLKDLVWCRLEGTIHFMSTSLGRILLPSWAVRQFGRILGIVDPPDIVFPTLASRIQTSSIQEILEQRPDVVLLQDTFTTFFKPEVVMSFLEITEKLGLRVAVLPYKPCGKVMHVRGKRKAFHAIAETNVQWLQQLDEVDIPIVGIDPACTLLWRDEYPEILGLDVKKTTVMLPQEWLIEQDLTLLQCGGTWRLFPHCIERAVVLDSASQWERIFNLVGATLEIVDTSCCGMGGLFGHESTNREESLDIWSQSWARHNPSSGNALATGHSCWVQATRAERTDLCHPLEILATR